VWFFAQYSGSICTAAAWSAPVAVVTTVDCATGRDQRSSRTRQYKLFHENLLDEGCGKQEPAHGSKVPQTQSGG